VGSVEALPHKIPGLAAPPFVGFVPATGDLGGKRGVLAAHVLPCEGRQLTRLSPYTEDDEDKIERALLTRKQPPEVSAGDIITAWLSRLPD